MPVDPRFPPEVQRARQHIDAIDKKILKLLKKRFYWSRRMARIKVLLDVPMVHEEREEAMYKRWKKIFKSAKVRKDFLDELFELIVEESKAVQEKYFHDKSIN